MDKKPDIYAALITEHLTRRPEMQARDIYKLLYQGIRGPEHIITSPQSFTQRLQQEWETLDLANQDPLSESIHPDGSLLRINLRPFKAAGGCLEALATACLETGLSRWGTQAELVHTWETLITSYQAKPNPALAWEELQTFTRWLEDAGYPPVHHSEHYRQLYRPAYRLVSFELNILQNLQEL